MPIATFIPLPETSPFTPAILSVPPSSSIPAFVLAWTGSDGQHKLNISRSDTGGTTWDKQLLRLGGPWEGSSAGPALALHNGVVFVCWAAAADQRLWLASSADSGRTWSGKRPIAEESSDGSPALVSYRGRLVVAWRGTDGAGTLTIATSPDDGASWGKVILPEWSIAGPSLAHYASGAGFSYLFLAFTGTDHLLRTRSCQGDDFASFGRPVASAEGQTLHETSDSGPAIAVLDAREGKDVFVAVSWRGTGDDQLHATYSLQGFSPYGNNTDARDNLTEMTPAMISYSDYPAEDDRLIMSWSDPAGHLNFAAADRIM
jgi:hypothetical protein